MARRPIAQLSNDEWRAALQQQINEKKMREQQQKRTRDNVGDAKSPLRQHKDHPELDDGFVGDEPQNGSDETEQERRASWSEQTSVRPGRRNVQQMSAQEWREALEQQIREKKAHVLQQKEAREGTNLARRTSQSAPSAQDQARSISEEPQQESGEHAMTTSGSMLGGAGRKRVGMQTQEEYLKQMQEQLELKKKFEQDALEYKKMLRQQRRCSLKEDDAQCSTDNLSNVVAVKPMASLLDSPSNNHAQENQAPDEPLSSPPPEQKSSKQPFTTGNQFESELLDNFEAKDFADTQEIANSVQSSVPIAVVDPIVFAKIVDFCEELKRQNDDVKKQLVEQHSVLACLKSSLVVTPETRKKDAEAKPSSSDSVAHSAPASVKKSHRVAASNSIPLQKQKSSLPKEKYPVSAKQSDLQFESMISGSGSRAALMIRARLQKGESKIPFPSKVKVAVALEQVVASEPAALTPTLKAQPKDDHEDQLPDKLTTPLSSSSQTLDVNKVIDDDGELVHEDKEVKAGLDSKDAKDANDELAELHFQTDSKDGNHDACTDDSKKNNEPERRIVEFGSDRESSDEEEEQQILHTSTRLERVDSAKLVYSTWEDDDIPLEGESKFLHCDAKSVDNNDNEEDAFEAKGEMKSCSSSFIFLDDGSSSLVPVEKSLDNLFLPEFK